MRGVFPQGHAYRGRGYVCVTRQLYGRGMCGGRFASGAGTCLQVYAGYAAGVCRVCGTYSAGCIRVCLCGVGVFASGLRDRGRVYGVGVCFHSGLDFRFFSATVVL